MSAQDARRTEILQALLQAFHDQDLDAFAGALHPEIEVEGLKGTFRGIEEVRRWATKPEQGGLTMRVEADRYVERGDDVAVAARRQWRWREDDSLAEETEFGILFTFSDGKVIRWRQRFESLEEALAAATEPEPQDA